MYAIAIKRIAFAGNINIGKTIASELMMNIIMNARSDIMPPINSHFQARANPRSPMANNAICKNEYKVIGEDVPLLALCDSSPININKAKTTIITLITRAIMRKILIEFVFIFLLSVIIVLTPHFFYFN